MVDQSKRNEQIEIMMDLIEDMMQEEGYRTLRFSNTKKYSTTEYDCLVLQDSHGREFTIGFNESKRWCNDCKAWEDTCYIED